ncbi:Endonuclease/Exonuclease/phosphatase family protein [Mycobacterium basiliense]|uniref:Endonuclease/Exonuclease/phosphatase family protein n=1 Tax=Mycobacterium basiliense TaxID=2094119 RepID=A0A3S4FQD2_9MYCO|nr:Ig-like domain-containing protein [Mycobacterium basiliense]VDM90450.1 Endonuclease/Exonuclease/phosphatase family protein [Mycobacterium basiliense]
MGHASLFDRVGALAVVLGVGAAVVVTPPIGLAAPTDSGSSQGDSWADIPSLPAASDTALAPIPGASLPGVTAQQVDPSSIPEDILTAVINFLAAVRNGVVPILANRTPVATPQQVSIPENGSTGPVPFTAYDPDGNRMTFKVNPRGTPGGPQHGVVAIDQRNASFVYTADPNFVGSDTFTVAVSDDTSLHVHGLAGYLGPFHGHDDVATVTVFVGNTPTDTISGDFSMLTYNIAGLPFPLSSAILPRFLFTKEIGKRLNGFFVSNVQEDFSYHAFLIKRSRMPSQTPPSPPTLLWPIGVPFSDGLNTLAVFKVKRLDRQTWWQCDADNCLTVKGFSYSQLQLPGGNTLDLYNLHTNTGGGALTNANLAQLSNYIQQNSAGRPVIVTGDFNARYSDDQSGLLQFAQNNSLTDAWVEVQHGPTTPPFAPTCMVGNECELLDKIFYRSGVGVTLHATAYSNEAPNFLNSKGQPLSDHSPPAVTFQYETTNVSAPP